MDDNRLIYERLLKAGSPRITLRDHGSVGEARGEKRKVSAAWNDFGHVEVDGKKEDYVACKRCRVVLRYNPVNGTSTMSRHSKAHADNASCGPGASSAGAQAQMAITAMPAVRGSNVPEGQLLKVKGDLARQQVSAATWIFAPITWSK